MLPTLKNNKRFLYNSKIFNNKNNIYHYQFSTPYKRYLAEVGTNMFKLYMKNE